MTITVSIVLALSEACLDIVFLKGFCYTFGVFDGLASVCIVEVGFAQSLLAVGVVDNGVQVHVNITLRVSCAQISKAPPCFS